MTCFWTSWPARWASSCRRPRSRRCNTNCSAASDGSIIERERLAEELLPPLLLRVAQNCLDLAGVLLADLHHLRPDLLRLASRLGFLDERLNLLLHPLHHGHEL